MEVWAGGKKDDVWLSETLADQAEDWGEVYTPWEPPCLAGIEHLPDVLTLWDVLDQKIAGPGDPTDERTVTSAAGESGNESSASGLSLE